MFEVREVHYSLNIYPDLIIVFFYFAVAIDMCTGINIMWHSVSVALAANYWLKEPVSNVILWCVFI